MPKLELLNLIFKQTISVYLGLIVFGNIFMLARRQYLDKFTFLVELCVCVQHEKNIHSCYCSVLLLNFLAISVLPALIFFHRMCEFDFV